MAGFDGRSFCSVSQDPEEFDEVVILGIDPAEQRYRRGVGSTKRSKTSSGITVLCWVFAMPWWGWVIVVFFVLVIVSGGDQDNPHGDMSMFGD